MTSSRLMNYALILGLMLALQACSDAPPASLTYLQGQALDFEADAGPQGQATPDDGPNFEDATQGDDASAPDVTTEQDINEPDTATLQDAATEQDVVTEQDVATEQDVTEEDTAPPVLDQDEDGVLDGEDNCPLTSNTNQKDEDEDDIGDACDDDKDNDGVVNEVDNCPKDANADQANWDADGKGDVCDSDDDDDGSKDEDDCEPLNSGINPDAEEVCDGVDNNCNQETDEDDVCWTGDCATVVTADGSVLLFCPDEQTWWGAQSTCEENGGHLASIHDDVEQAFISNMLWQFDEGSWWIGGTDQWQEGSFKWKDDSPFDYTHWTANEPNNYNLDEHCVEMAEWASYSWNDRPCWSQLPFICKL